jgi:hypothetical protein
MDGNNVKTSRSAVKLMPLFCKLLMVWIFEWPFIGTEDLCTVCVEYKWVTVVKLEQKMFLIVDYSGDNNSNGFGQAVESCYIGIRHRVLEHCHCVFLPCGHLVLLIVATWTPCFWVTTWASQCNVTVCARQTLLHYANLWHTNEVYSCMYKLMRKLTTSFIGCVA